MRDALLVTWDRLPLDWLGCYGSERGWTGPLDELAVLLTVFENCYLADRPERERMRFDEHVESLKSLRVAVEQCRSVDHDHLRQWLLSGDQATGRLWWVRPGDASLDSHDRAAAPFDWLAGWDDVLVQPRRRPLLVVICALAGLDWLGEESTSLPADLRETIRHVPLLVRQFDGTAGTEQADFGQRRRELATLADVTATLVEWFVPDVSNAHGSGRSLLGLLGGNVADWRETLMLTGETAAGLRTEGDFYCETFARSGEGNVSEPERCWYFLKPDDAFDRLNLAAQYQDRVEELRCRLGLAGEPTPDQT